MSSEQRQMQIEHIINMYKSKHGVKPRSINFSKVTDAGLEHFSKSLEEG